MGEPRSDAHVATRNFCSKFVNTLNTKPSRLYLKMAGKSVKFVDSGSGSDDDAPEEVTANQSKARALEQERAIKSSEVKLKQQRKEANRLRDSLSEDSLDMLIQWLKDGGNVGIHGT